MVIAGSIVIAALALLYLWQGWQLAHLQAQLAAREELIAKLEAQVELLRLQAEQAFSLKRIELLAKTLLGMVEPELSEMRIIRLPKGPLRR